MAIASATLLIVKNFEVAFKSPMVNYEEIDSICEETD